MPKNSFHKYSGFSLIEILVALGISAIVLTSALGVLSSIYFSQKQVLFSHDYYSENRFLMERIAQMIRNHTLDYDRMFITYGPNPAAGVCNEFDRNQTPTGSTVANTGSLASNNRANLGYKTIFYWNTDGDSDQDRNLGGKNPIGNDDPCTEAWADGTSLNYLYLINSARTQRIAITLNQTTNRVEVQKTYGADLDDDGEADIYGPIDNNNDGDTSDASDIDIIWNQGGSNACQLAYDQNGNNFIEPTEYYTILESASNEDFCRQAHNWVPISPRPIIISELNFQAHPNRDPYLAFRVDTAQVHPLVFISMTTELRDPDAYGFTNVPSLSFQTAVSSRIYGDIRR